MSVIRYLRRGHAAALLFAAAVILAGGSVGAIELPAGSKNFNAPSSTPNYFSNEVGAAQGNRSAGSVPIGHISGPSVGHAVVMSGAHGKPGKIVRLRAHSRAAHRHVRRVASRHRSASAHAHHSAKKATTASSSRAGGRHR